jgi:hypothetical protein
LQWADGFYRKKKRKTSQACKNKEIGSPNLFL